MKPLRIHDSPDCPADLDTTCAADVMQKRIVTVQAGDPIHEVERVLAEAKVTGVPVLDDNEHVIGMISMTDLVKRHADDDGPEEADYLGVDDDLEDAGTVMFRRSLADEMCAADLVTGELALVSPTASLREVSRIMVSEQTHRLLVVQHNRLLGLVSTMDVLRAIAR